jgi:hypothetical protein
MKATITQWLITKSWQEIVQSPSAQQTFFRLITQ